MNYNEEERNRNIRHASLLGIIGNAFLSILKITVGILSHSLALIGDGIDSFSDIVTSLISLFAVRIMAEPPDRKHPWGHGRAETIATRFIGFTMFTAGLQLLLSVINQLMSGELSPLRGGKALYVALISIVLKSLLALYKGILGKRLNSSLLLADARNMRNDVFLSVGVLGGLLLSIITGSPLFDKIIALLLSLYIMYSAVKIFRESGEELMDGLEDPAVYKQLFEAVGEVPGACHPHRCRIRRINTLYDIDLDIEADGNLSLIEAHDIAHQVEKAIRKKIPLIFDIMVHVEPTGQGEHDEQFGLSPDELEEK
ncbi:MAG: cation diffusion facilitator family transporter [Spirochaetales bacterium]|nr:cation diffusion facilitator family transporter [Spirochaetales bacterium]